MKYIITYLSLILLAGFLITGCSEVRKDLPVQPSTSVVHGEGFSKVGNPNFHGNFIRQHDWEMKNCQQCHVGYNAGATGVSCKTCHKSDAGPEACNTCHGDFNVPQFIAPPRDASGNTQTTARGVGAHTSHLYSTALSKAVECQECHVVPTAVYQPGHINNSVEIVFGTFTKAKALSTPVYNSADQTCANTYCHGNFAFSKDSAAVQDQYIFTGTTITGNNFTPQWVKVDGSQKQCGTCHGLPPQGHLGVGVFTLTSCGGSGCHFGVVDESGKIIDQNKHINASVNVRGK
ncbi:MAG: CxxxxCH/CxxCH domain c-type cytochrome [Ignavibacteriales bacterium]